MSELQQLDIAATTLVEIQIHAGGKVLWVHHAGITVLRISQIPKLSIDDGRLGRRARCERELIDALVTYVGELRGDIDAMLPVVKMAMWHQQDNTRSTNLNLRSIAKRFRKTHADLARRIEESK